jgi:hypothetical protein
MFVRFSCGCIGTIPDIKNYSILVDFCAKDHADDQYCFNNSINCKGKSFDHLSEDEELQLIVILDNLIRDGYKFRTIKNALGAT